jgi:hypothetical protein
MWSSKWFLRKLIFWLSWKIAKMDIIHYNNQAAIHYRIQNCNINKAIVCAMSILKHYKWKILKSHHWTKKVNITVELYAVVCLFFRYTFIQYCQQTSSNWKKLCRGTHCLKEICTSNPMHAITTDKKKFKSIGGLANVPSKTARIHTKVEHTETIK